MRSISLSFRSICLEFHNPAGVIKAKFKISPNWESTKGRQLTRIPSASDTTNRIIVIMPRTLSNLKFWKSQRKKEAPCPIKSSKGAIFPINSKECNTPSWRKEPFSIKAAFIGWTRQMAQVTAIARLLGLFLWIYRSL